MGYIAALILVVMLLPLLGMLYMDVLQTKKEAKTQIEKMEKLRRDIEKQQREKDK
jgi:Tfp pilus assembly protein PilV